MTIISKNNYYLLSIIINTLPWERVKSIVMSMSVCRSVRSQLVNNTADLHQILCVLPVAVARSFSGGVAIRYVGYTFGFLDDVMFAYHGASGLESSTRLCLEEVLQVAVS